MPDLLRFLSDSKILSRTRDLAARERAITLHLLVHLNEIERRKLHLQQGYSSMWDYCTLALGYSEPATARRLRTARCIALFPEIHFLLERNEVNLSTISRVSRVLTADNKEQLLGRIRGKSLREVEAMVAEYRPLAKKLHDEVRTVVVQVIARGEPPLLPLQGDWNSPTPETHTLNITTAGASAVAGSTAAGDSAAAGDLAAPAGSGACEKSDYCRSDSKFDPTSTVERHIRFRFCASESLEKKIDKVRSLAWHRLPANPSLEHVFELVLDAYIERHDPLARRERRTQRSEAKAIVTSERASRRVPAQIMDDVFARDGGRCSFVAPDGKRCGSTLGLQVDHIVPVARGGVSTMKNLRLLCAYHNRYESERLMGPRPETAP
ncbi:MAG TPA: HNH endonuclease signature motif containing protein [Candidatus Krumholzibacteria bacterium]|nr:HNH endonuclease signature motif containing protein [Candidatus Krumholzibacteria bacterium]